LFYEVNRNILNKSLTGLHPQPDQKYRKVYSKQIEGTATEIIFMSSLYYFISDLHLTPEKPDIQDNFIQFLDSLEPQTSALYILGDLFDYWIGDDAALRLGHESIIKILSKLSDRGTDLFFLPGNRDFLVGDHFAKESGCHLLDDPSRVMLNGTSILLTHGDLLCTDDTAHQKFRSETRNADWKNHFLELPIDQRQKFALDLRSQSKDLKQKKPSFIMDTNQNSVEEIMLDNGVHTLIHGHTHRPETHHFDLDGSPATRMVLGDWSPEASFIRLDESGFFLKKA
jgi:UDP-2,3-diacylglucosamine hydrolase|tara:strand:+ start:42519 stop:43370 length:852 start_codon:yes stop_codon:yes gene_type:complete